ncbi:hypothetical protein [Deinococcus yunweiensis]|uniref:hypothetical protein n=1 Tax=Deinococcus yunweiensis TaxID=367282 RepID=UPI00398E90F0
MTVRSLVVAGVLLLNGCKGGTGSVDLTPSAQFFLDHGGLSIVATPSHPLSRPCLKGLSMSNTLVGGLVGASRSLLDFIDIHRLASLTRSQRSSVYEKVVFTPLPPYTDNWVGAGDFKAFYFGEVTLVKVELVADAQPITAGAGEPYLIPGTSARASRITFRLDDVPGGNFTADLTTMPNLLTTDSMRPADYGQELMVVATLPVDPTHFNVTP